MKPDRTLLQGRPYVPSHATDIAATFKRIRKAQREAAKIAESAQRAADADHDAHKQRLEANLEAQRRERRLRAVKS